MDANLHRSLVNLLTHVRGEEQDYIQKGQPSDHIYRDIMRVREWVNGMNPQH